jgi:hypothetical protein
MDTEALQIAQIRTTLKVIYVAECDKCGIEDRRKDDKNVAAAQLYIEGWRVSDAGEIHCPGCVGFPLE